MPYLYAVVGGTTRPELTEGGFGEPLSLLPAGSVSAVVGAMRVAPEVSKASLSAHDRVVRALSSSGPLLPARFGQVDDADALRAALVARERAFAAALALVEGCVQMTVRLKLTPPADEASVSGDATTRDPVRKRSGRAYLEAQRARRSPPQLERLLRALSPWTRAERSQLSGEPRELASLYHLVPLADVEAWRRALTESRAESGARLQVTGPWPPYAFVPELA